MSQKRSCLALALVVIVMPSIARSEGNPLREAVLKAKRILFLGDSITASGQYVAIFEAWLLTQPSKERPLVINAGLPSETVSGLSEDGHADGKFPRPKLADRLDSVLQLAKPDVVVVCYGINCGIYQPYDKDRFLRYQEGLLQVHRKVKQAGASCIFMTPPSYDDLRGNKSFSYNQVLDQYSAWLVGQRAQGWNVLDLHTAMTIALKDRRKQNPDFTFQPDAVHPDEAGHWFIASQLIKWLDDDASASRTNAQEMLAAKNIPVEVLTLVRKRSLMLRDAYVHAAGHQRPGVARGLPLEEALSKANAQAKQIDILMTKP